LKSATKTLFAVSLLALLALGLVVPGFAQDQLNLGDGILNSFFFGGSNTPHPQQITMVIPSMNCNGSPLTCYMANGHASGAGPHLGGSSGTYTVSSAATMPVLGNWAGPFYLTVQPDGHSIVTQTQQIQFNYTSPQGTLTGLLNFTTVSASYLTSHGYWADVLGMLTVTGGTFAQYFPSGGNVHISLGVPNLPLQLFPTVPNAFTTVEFETGTIIPAQTCGLLSPDWKNPSGDWKQQAGLPRVAGFSTNDLIAGFTQTNNPTQIPCSPSTPCGSMDVALGTGSFSADLVVTVQLSGPGQPFQFDRMGFNSDIGSGLFLDCFNFGASCTSGVGGASLQGAKQEDGFGRFQNTLYTGLNGGSGCAPDGTGCQNLFTFVIGDSHGSLQLSDFNAYVAGHIANGACSGFIATPGH
jgi:hypothetical protein